jgi:hypothetical protein
MLDMGTKGFRSAIKKAYQLRRERSGSCVSNRNTTKPHKQKGKRTRSTTRVSIHTHSQGHYQTSKFSTFSKTTWYFSNCFIFFGSNFNA